MHYQSLRLRGKMLLFLILPIILVMLGSGFITYRSATRAVSNANESQYLTLRKALGELATATYEMTQLSVESNLRTAKALLAPKIRLSSQKHTLQARHQVNGSMQTVTLPRLMLGQENAWGNNLWVDSLSHMLGGAATVFQMMPGGMVRVSTSVRKEDGSRALGTYIPDTSPVHAAIASGREYYGRALVAGDWYVAAYSPLMQGQQVIGALIVGIPQGN